MFPEPIVAPRRQCARCGHLTRADRMVKGFGRDCAAQLGLLGRSVDVGQQGADLFDAMDEEMCDGWDR